MRYFQTSVPSSVLYAGGDAPVKWTTGDGITGYFCTSDEQILRYLDRLIKSRKEGNPQGPPFEEISKEAYDDALGKWKGRRFERDREYLGSNGAVPAQVPGQLTAVVGRVAAADTLTPPAEPRPTPTDLDPESPAPTSPEAPVTPAPAPTVRRRGKAAGV